MLPTPTAPVQRLGSLFSAVTSAMQPARFPLALFAVLLVTALVPLVDLAGGSKFGPRGFSGGELSLSEQEMDYQRARAAVRRFAGLELAAIEGDAADGDAATPRRDASLGELRAAVREGTQRRIRALDEASDPSAAPERASEIRSIRQTAANAMRQIDDAGPHGVASVFLENERLALKQTVNAVFKLDLEGFVTGILSAVFTVPAAAIRAEPIVFPLALVVTLAALSLCAGGLCRMAAVHAGRGARLAVLEGPAFARARALNLVSLPILPIAVLAVLAIVILAFVALLRVPVLNVVSGLLFIVPLAVALLGAILALVAIAAAPLMPAAVAVEDCDAGEAITRASSLILSRPLLWLSALAICAVALALGSILTAGVLALGSNTLDGVLALAGGDVGAVLASGDGAAIATLFGPDRLIALLVGFWSGIFQLLGAAYACSLACDLAARAYLLMRERIDGESPSTVSGYGIG